jgi:hypothetical protein
MKSNTYILVRVLTYISSYIDGLRTEIPRFDSRQQQDFSLHSIQTDSGT